MIRICACALLLALSALRPVLAAPQQDASASSGPAAAEQAVPVQSQSKSQAGKNEAKDTAKSSAATAKKRRAVKRAAAPVPDGSPKKVVIREGGLDEPTAQIVTGMPPAEAARDRSAAELLLSTTEETLQEIAPRDLDTHQQETVSQIHNYMGVARSALREGDIPRAHTLAEKAALLADDIAKH
jgi:hypothetical protein